MNDEDEQRFDACFRSSHRRLLAQAYLFTADSAKAQDLTQEAFERLWRNWGTAGALEDPESWTRKVLFNLCVSDWRKTSRRRDVRMAVMPDVLPPPTEEHIVLIAALRKLPPKQAKALVLHAGMGFTVPEIALEMSASEGTVKSWISRGRSRLARDLGEPGPAIQEGRSHAIPS